jgi:hypothetical protein
MIQMIRFVIDKRLTADQQQDLASSSRGFNYKKLLEEMKATSAAEKRPSSITNSSWLH